MKPYYLKNVGEYHSRLTSKLAVLLLALPFAGAFATDLKDTNYYVGYDYVSQLGAKSSGDNATFTFEQSLTYLSVGTPVSGVYPTSSLEKIDFGSAGKTLITVETLYSTADHKYLSYFATSGVSTGSGPVLNSYANNVYVTSSNGLALSPASWSALNIYTGDEDKPSKVTVNNGIMLHAANVTLGSGDGTYSYGGNSLAIQGYALSNYTQVTADPRADISATGEYSVVYNADASSYPPYTDLAVTKLSALTVKVGSVSDGNSLSVKDGASASVTSFSIGAGTKAISADSNSATLSGSASTPVSSGSVTTILSTISNDGALTLGYYGSKNTLSISGTAYMKNKGAIKIGEKGGSSNGITLDAAPSGKDMYTLTGGAVTIGDTGSENSLTLKNGATANLGAVAIASAAGSTKNAINSTSSTLKVTELGVGLGSANTVTITGGTLDVVGPVVLGYGDTNKDGGFTATQGSSNELNLASAALQTSATVYTVGSAGSSNELTIAGASILTGKYDKDNKKATGSAALTIGTGLYNDSVDFSGAGNSNTVTVKEASSILAASTVVVGDKGSANKLVVTDGAYFGGLVDLKSDTKGATGPLASLIIGQGESDHTLAAIGESKYAKNNKVELTSVGTSEKNYGANLGAVTVGSYGSGNSLAIKDSYVAASSIKVGECAKLDSSSILGGSVIAANNNAVTVTGDSLLKLTDSITVGDAGVSNTFTVSDAANVWSTSGYLNVGVGSSLSGAGDNNAVVVTGSGSILKVAKGVVIGSVNTDASNSSLEVASGALVIVDVNAVTGSSDLAPTAAPLLVHSELGTGNVIKLNGGFIAIRGKAGSDNADSDIDSVWEMVYGADYKTSNDTSKHVNGLIDNGSILVMNAGEYQTASASDISVTYFSSDADALAATGYDGLAGYTVISASGTVSSDYAWANVEEQSGNYYKSAWYNWFYSTSDAPEYIMSFNDYSWQYVDQANTADSAYFYDYSLGAWIFTNETYMQNKWYYNYGTAAWAQFE